MASIVKQIFIVCSLPAHKNAGHLFLRWLLGSRGLLWGPGFICGGFRGVFLRGGCRWAGFKDLNDIKVSPVDVVGVLTESSSRIKMQNNSLSKEKRT